MWHFKVPRVFCADAAFGALDPYHTPGAAAEARGALHPPHPLTVCMCGVNNAGMISVWISLLQINHG
jgi:hypothetical protein